MTFSQRFLRNLAIAHDLTVCIIAFIASHLVVFGYPGILSMPGIGEKTAAFVLICVIGLYAARLNRGHWRYASISDMIAIAKAATIAVALYTIGNFLLSRAENVSRVGIILLWIFMVFGLGAGRLIYRSIKERHPFVLGRRAPRNVSGALLYPFSDATDTYLRALSRLHASRVWPIGIIDSSHGTRKQNLHNVPVLGTIADIGSLVIGMSEKGTPVKELIVTDAQVSGTQMTELLDACNAAGIMISRLPSMLHSSATPITALLTPKPVRLDDLLGRAEINTPHDEDPFLASKVVMVTGAGGSIGSELCRQIASSKPERLIFAELSEQNLYDIQSEFGSTYPEISIVPVIADIRDRNRIENLIRVYQPDVIFHAAALKHVPIVESNRLEAIKTNLLGTADIAFAALRQNVGTFVLISTDKAVNPASIMGATKRAAELYCQTLDNEGGSTHFRIVRFGNVLGSAGSVVPLFQKQIAAGGPVTITDAGITRFFMTIQEAVQLVLRAASFKIDDAQMRGLIFVLDMGQPVKIVDLAKRLIKLAGFVPEKEIQITYSGLRAGEKMEEELLSSAETVVETTDLGFVVARSRSVKRSEIERKLDELRRACWQEDEDASLKLLGEIVLSYRPRQKD